MTKQGIHWDIKQVAAHLTFPPDAVSEDSTVTLLRWHPQTRFPPLHGNEAIVSDVIELSVESPEGLCFNKEVTLVISHCAADVKGYEVVMKMLIDRDSNEWVDIFGTVDLRSLSGKKYYLPFYICVNKARKLANFINSYGPLNYTPWRWCLFYRAR